MDTALEHETLANGAALVCLPRPGAHGVAFGLWLHNGSRHEAPDEHGYAHLLEHLFFRGTATRTASAIARLCDRWGGQVNASTGRELTTLQGLVPRARFAGLADLVLDMLLNAAFTEDDLRAERGVAVQELAEARDAPEEAAEQRLIERIWPDHPMGRDILGAAHTLGRVCAGRLHTYRRGLLQGRRLCAVAVGAVDMTALQRACAPLAGLPPGTPPASPPPRFVPGQYHERHPPPQAGLLWAMAAPAAGEADFAAAAVANQILGGGLSSRLFRRIREELGLAYDISSRLEIYSDCGLWLIRTACAPEAAQRCRREVNRVIERLAEHGPADEELVTARERLACGLVLAQDDLEGTMERLGREHFLLGRHPTLAERLAQISTVGPAEVRELIRSRLERCARLLWGA